MTLQGWSQILLFFVVILALTPPLGAFLHRVLEGERHVLQRPLGWLERLLLRLGGADGREQSWQTYSLGMLAFSAFTMLVTYAVQRMQHLLPFNPQGLGPVEAALGLQHGRQLHDQHELAGLRRRVDDELPQPDGGPRLAQLHLRRGGHRGGGGARPRDHPARRRPRPGHGRQLLDGRRARDGLRAAADLVSGRARLRLAGCGSDLRPLRGGHDRRGREPVDRARAGRLAGGDQAARARTAAGS